MSKEADSLIARMERETGQRVDDNGGDNLAIAGLFGALARAIGDSPFSEKDDVAAGTLIRHQMTPEYERERSARCAMASMLAGGMSPDDLKALMG